MRILLLAGLLAMNLALAPGPALAATPGLDRPDVDLFMRDDAIGQIKLSPDGRFYAATVPGEGRSVLMMVRREDNKAIAMFSLGKNSYVYDFQWVNPTRVLISMAEKIGLLDQPMLTGNLYAIDADGGDPEILVGQDVREMSAGSRIRRKETEHVAAFLLDALPDDDRNVLIEVSGFAGDSYSRVEKMDVYSGRRQRVTSGPVINASFATDGDGEVRFIVGSDIENTSKLFHRAGDDAEWELVNDESVSGMVVWPLGFSGDGKVAYLQAERAGGPDAVVAFDPATGKRSEVFRDDDVDPMSTIRGSRGVPVGVVLPDGRTRSVFFDPEGEDARLVRSLEQAFEGSTVRVTSRTADGKLLLVEVDNDRNPGDIYLFDTQDKQARYMISRREWLDPEAMAGMRPIQLEARDGLDLHGYLTLPPGSAGKDVPLVVMPHGGPYGIADVWGFDPQVQLLAAAGYGVLQVNFRGSGFRGRDFLQAGAQQWGRAMQDDITDATRWAIAEGIADADRICIFGASYGAYAALMGVAREPTLYQCAIGYVGVYDLPLMYGQGDTRELRSGLAFLRDWVGERAGLAAVSPVHLADRIDVPVFLAAGGEDERTPIEHSHRMERALRQAGVPVETLYYDTEGHGFYVDAHRVEFQQRVLGFLERHIGPKDAATAGVAGAASTQR